MGKIYQGGDYEAVHRNPLFRDRADFIISAYLGEKDSHSEWEQLWVKRLGERRFSLCCIPFFSYDLALDDEVETDENYVVKTVVKASGQHTIRIWFGNSPSPAVKVDVLQRLEKLGVQLEWSSDNLLAISACNSERAQEVQNYLYTRQSAGDLIYETGNF